MNVKYIFTTLVTSALIMNMVQAKEKFIPVMMNNGLMTCVPYGAELPESVPETWTQELIDTLSYMGNEERLAYDVYNRLYTEWGTQQFINIASQSEINHIQAVQAIIQKYSLDETEGFTNTDLPALNYSETTVEEMEAGTYDISKIQGLYEDLTAAGMVSEIEALKVGCTVEVVDITDLNSYIEVAETAQADDVLETFTFLRSGSYTHYWAFDNGLKIRGLSEGCCTWDELCHREYPQN